MQCSLAVKHSAHSTGQGWKYLPSNSSLPSTKKEGSFLAHDGLRHSEINNSMQAICDPMLNSSHAVLGLPTLHLAQPHSLSNTQQWFGIAFTLRLVSPTSAQVTLSIFIQHRWLQAGANFAHQIFTQLKAMLLPWFYRWVHCTSRIRLSGFW